MRRALVMPVVLLALTACHVGPSAENFAPAIGPDGIWAELGLKGVRVEGELLWIVTPGPTRRAQAAITSGG